MEQEKFKSLADFLGELEGNPPSDAPAQFTPPAPQLEDIEDSKAFSIALLNSREFRQYILNSLTLGTIPPAIITRVMDYGWGRPADRVEHTGKDGQPIETVTEVRRIIVSVPPLHPTIN